MDNKKIYYFLLAIFLIGGFGFFYTRNKAVKEDFAANSKNNLGDENLSENNSDYKLLAIDPIKCIGCNKCVRFDSEHFEMMGNKARVISSKNLSSKNLKTAINICPTVAISLN